MCLPSPPATPPLSSSNRTRTARPIQSKTVARPLGSRGVCRDEPTTGRGPSVPDGPDHYHQIVPRSWPTTPWRRSRSGSTATAWPTADRGHERRSRTSGDAAGSILASSSRSAAGTSTRDATTRSSARLNTDERSPRSALGAGLATSPSRSGPMSSAGCSGAPAGRAFGARPTSSAGPRFASTAARPSAARPGAARPMQSKPKSWT